MTEQITNMSPRARASLSRVHAGQTRASVAMHRSLSVLIALWVIWAGIQFVDVYRDPQSVSVQNLILVVLTLAVGWFILRLYRKQSGARTR
jgi:hypothetical protein